MEINVRRWEGLLQTKTKKHPQFVPGARIQFDRAKHLMTGPITAQQRGQCPLFRNDLNESSRRETFLEFDSVDGEAYFKTLSVR